MPTPEEITRKAVELARYLTSPETLTPRTLSGPWDACRLLLIRDGHDEQRVRLEIDGHEGGAELPAWGAAVEEWCEALLVFALVVLEPGPPVTDLVLLSTQVNDDVPDGSGATLQRLREVTAYWRSRLAVEGNEVSEHDLLTAARGNLGADDFADLLPHHRRAARLRAAALLLSMPAPDHWRGLTTMRESLEMLAREALEEGR